MAGEVFISYRRVDEARAIQLHRLLKSRGVDAWYDAQLTAGEEWRAGITQALEAAPVFVLLFSRAAAESAEIAKELAVATVSKKIVVPVRLEDIQPKGAFLYELASRNWFDAFDGDEARFTELADRLAAAVRGEADALEAAPSAPAAKPQRKGVSICVLPFVNMSGDAEQEYFSDGISEDIITDLSKVSALWVAARNTAFTFKGKSVDVPTVARDLAVSHVLEGSVRKAGQRVRITAQLIDADGGHVWAERYDRDLTDIFALQDEIAEAIVKVLKVKLLPEEKKAIEERGTASAEAYRYYLMGRQFLARGNASLRMYLAIIRLCRRAVELDPGYAKAWRLMAFSQEQRRFLGDADDDGTEAIERALALDDTLGEAHSVRAMILARQDRFDEAEVAMARAMSLAPDLPETNAARASLCMRQGKLAEAADSFERASVLDPANFSNAGMMASVCMSLGQTDRARAAARRSLERVEPIVANELDNSAAISWLVSGLCILGEVERARDWVERAMVIDPDDGIMRYNFACCLANDLGDPEGAIDLLEPTFRSAQVSTLGWIKADPDFNGIREHPRFVALLAEAEKRLVG